MNAISPASSKRNSTRTSRVFKKSVQGSLLGILAALLLNGPASVQAGSPGPTTWHVLVGGTSAHQAIQAEGYYPHVMTIDAGDTVVWTLNTNEVHSVTFIGTCGDLSCVPPCVFQGLFDFSPCGPASYDGISALASSGRMIEPGYNWDNSLLHGGTTYSLTFTTPGTNVYFDLSVSGMRGVVVVNPAGTPYPLTPAQYSEQAQQEMEADLEAGSQARDEFKPPEPVTNPDGTHLYRVAPGTNPPERSQVRLRPASGSTASGTALLIGSEVGTSMTPTVAVTTSVEGLTPGSVHAVQILLGVCGAPAPAPGLFFSGIFVPPTFTLNDVVAGADGTASVTTVISQPPNPNGPGQLRIPSAGWFVNVEGGPVADDGATSVACGNVTFHNASVMRYLPAQIHISVGDTVEWADETINEIHGVTFLAGQSLPLIPDWVFETPSTSPTTYDGSSYLSSGPLYAPDAGRNQSFAVTFTRAGTFPYVDVPNSLLVGMQGAVVVTAPGS